MLKYNIKLTDDNIQQEKLVWSEKYLAPDLSFVSGVTSQDYHLEKFNRLPLSNTIVNNRNSSAALETKNVTRQGYVVIKNKEYPIGTGTIVDYSVESSGNVIEYSYLFLNGKYYYETESGFTIDNWLIEQEDGIPSEGTITLLKEQDGDDEDEDVEEDKVAFLDTIVWIEDGMVSIDGYDYYFDREVQMDDESFGGLKYFEDGACLDYSAITSCDSIEFHPFSSTTEYIDVTKIKLTKEEEINEKFDNISFCKRFYYVKYKDYYLPIRLEDGWFVCNIPNYVLGTYTNKIDKEYYITNDYPVYYLNEEGFFTDEIQISGDSFDTLAVNSACVIIEGDIFKVEHEVINANFGNEIAIYLNGDTSNISIGDRIRLVDGSHEPNIQYVTHVNDYGFNADDTEFVLFNGKKYKVEANLCDKVIINDNEYSIDYINGKKEGNDCLVLIGEEEVPMKIESVDGGSESAGTLTRYGTIISGGSNYAVTAHYPIVAYSGITVDKKRYILKEEATPLDDDEVEYRYYAYLDRNIEYPFIVTEIQGSSMVICIPDVNTTDFTDEFYKFISDEICLDVVDNKANMVLYIKNKIFGDKEITEGLVFQRVVDPVSSDDYFNLFENLDVYTKSGYIHIPLSLGNSQGNNILQDDIVQKQFYEEKKKDAINPIVDMEKDIYLPKYIDNNNGKYTGSNTIFKPIKEIRVNLHFRTRDLDSWKVNDGYNDISTEDITDNWFVTDYHPYVDILNDPTKLINKDTLLPYKNTEKEEVSKVLLNMPDLVGLLNFTNDDVYYQKSKIAKSFLRFSFYDSIDQQSQSLLCTSCVFMDEHRLFKRYIDNSRKNISDFGYVSAPKMVLNEQTSTFEDTAKGKITNRINVKTEFLGNREDNSDKYLKDDNSYYTEFKGAIVDDNHRLGSEFIINNKYETDTSSEGYYIYIFREYSENLKPKPIYMKIEFNHAGIGKTIPFIIPMEWTAMTLTNNDGTEETSRNGKKVPTRPYTLANDADINKLKEGIKLGDVYAQSYIPLYAVYDFKNKEYAYVFDSRYVEQDENDVINLNLFEMKIMNEEIPATATEKQVEDMQKDITYRRQDVAVIDINKKQFDDPEEECGR